MNLVEKMLFSVVLIFIISISNYECSTSNLQEHFKSLSQKKYDERPPRRIIVVPIMLHIDRSLRKKLAKDKIQVGRSLRKFATNLLTEAQKNFAGLTENYQINLKLLKARSLKASNYTRAIGEASTYLKNYCDWQAHVKWARNVWHYSVLLTGLDMYYVNTKGKKITASTGRTYMSGMCSLTKSCSVVEWRPDRAAHLLTHEIAHSLGVNHDGPPKNKCRPGDRNMMTSKYKWTRRPKVWNECNKRDFKRYISSRRSACLFCEENQRLMTKRHR